jgi:hypothetical protein
VRPHTRATAAAHTALSNMEQAQADKKTNRLQAGQLARNKMMADLEAGGTPTTRLHHTPRVCNRQLEVKPTIRPCTQTLLPQLLTIG